MQIKYTTSTTWTANLLRENVFLRVTYEDAYSQVLSMLMPFDDKVSFFNVMPWYQYAWSVCIMQSLYGFNSTVIRQTKLKWKHRHTTLILLRFTYKKRQFYSTIPVTLNIKSFLNGLWLMVSTLYSSAH